VLVELEGQLNRHRFQEKTDGFDPLVTGRNPLPEKAKGFLDLGKRSQSEVPAFARAYTCSY
jgi:hypothetical protein